MRKQLVTGCLVTLAVVGGYALSPGAFWRTADAPGSAAPYRMSLVGGESAEAEIAFYQARVKANPDGFLDLAALAGAYVRQARATGQASWYMLAEQAARRSVASFDGHPAALLVLVQVAIARHDFLAAEAMAVRLAAAYPEDLGVKAQLVTIDLATGELDRARRTADALAEAAPGLASASQQALVLQAQGRDEAAIAAFHRAIRLEQPGQIEGSALARAWLGRLHLEHGRLELAADLLREARRLRPEHPVVAGLSGDVAMRVGSPAEARRFYETAYAEGRHPGFAVGLARALAATGRQAEAAARLAEAEKALRRQLAAEDFGHRRDLARLLLERGGAVPAREALALLDAELVRRQDAETRYLRAWSLAETGAWQAARAELASVMATGARRAEWRALASKIEQALGQAGAEARRTV